jgi:hypothetical protein
LTWINAVDSRLADHLAVINRVTSVSIGRVAIPAAFGRAMAFAVVAMMLQLGVANVALPMEMSQPAGTASIPHHSGNSTDSCPDSSCLLEQCAMSAGTGCHCFCAQVPLESPSETTLAAYLPAIGHVADIPGSAPGRLSRPFRPPT